MSLFGFLTGGGTRGVGVTPDGRLMVETDGGGAGTDETRPAANAAAITPTDGIDLTTPTRALLIGVAGNVSVDMVESGTAVVLMLPAGIHALAVKRVRATGTTATGLVALW